MRVSRAIVTFSSVLVLAGCGGMPGVTTTSTTGGAQGASIKGKVYGGQQPLGGASVYLYAANTKGYGAASVSLLTSASNTSEDSNGNYYVTTGTVASGTPGMFSITGDYTCPSSSSQVYLYSVGGDSGSGSNSAAGLLAALGSCGSLTSSTYVTINEVSTVAAAYAIAGFATDATHVSSSDSTLGQTGIANAFAAIPNLECVANASLQCVQSGGSNFTGVTNATTPAGNGTVPQNEINTLADILAACVNSTGPLATGCTTLLGSALAGGTSGTQPTDSATAAINIAHNPWANIATLYGLATASAPFQPTLTSQPNDWTISIAYTGGGLDGSDDLAIDASGNVWVANLHSGVSEFSPAGQPLSGSSGFTGGGLNGPYGIAIDGTGDAWATSSGPVDLSELNQNGMAISPVTGDTGGGLVSSPNYLAIDGSNDVWLTNSGATDISEFNSSGSPVSGSSGFNGGGYSGGYGIAVDTSGNIWASGGSGLTEYIPGSSTWQTGSPFSGGGLNQPYGVAVDGSGNVWVANYGNSTLGEFITSTDTWSANSPISGGGLNAPFFLAFDGDGNVWATNYVGNSISEFNSSGTAITGSNGYTNSSLSNVIGIGIDGSGNVWVASNALTNSTISEFVGAAAPVVTPLVANLMNPYGLHAVNKP